MFKKFHTSSHVLALVAGLVVGAGLSRVPLTANETNIAGPALGVEAGSPIDVNVGSVPLIKESLVPATVWIERCSTCGHEGRR